MASNWRITVTLPEQFKQFLELWAENEHRSVSNLAASILINAAQEKMSISEATLENKKSLTIKKSNSKANPAKSAKSAKSKPIT